MRVLGLTGGICMGKSTAARQLRRAGLPVFDADRVVHALQAPGGAAVPAIAALVPEAVRDGAVDRAVLRARVVTDPALLPRLEAILHPLVARARATFLRRARATGARWCVLDIPLLLELGTERECDLVLVVSAPRDVQRARLRRTRHITKAEADRLIARQMPDAEKRRRADVVIHTGLSRAHTCSQVTRLLRGRLGR